MSVTSESVKVGLTVVCLAESLVCVMVEGMAIETVDATVVAMGYWLGDYTVVDLAVLMAYL